MSTTPQRQVHPAASAVLILLGLVGGSMGMVARQVSELRPGAVANRP